jgi:hypothetical protein
MLTSMDGRQSNTVPHPDDFAALLRRMGDATANSVRTYLDQIIDRVTPDQGTGRRTFNSTHLGAELMPWPEPLIELYHQSRALLGTGANENEVQERASWWFGLFVWERLMERENETWVWYDPNVSSTDPNREPIGKTYFER